LLAINLAVFAALVLVAEAALRLLGIARPAFYRYDPVRGFSHRPGAQGWWTQEGKGWVQINSAGFRDSNHSNQPRPGVLRIAVLGDSFSEAFQVNLAETWWKQLEQQLNSTPGCALRQGYPGGVEVMNFGVGAYGTGQEWLTWRQAAAPRGAQVVLLAMFLGNDIADNTPQVRDDRPVIRLNRQGQLMVDNSFRQSPGSRFRRSWVGRSLDELIEHSRIAQLLNAAKNRRNQRSGSTEKVETPKPPQSSVAGWAVTTALLKQLQRETKALGSSLIVTSLTSPDQVWPDRQQRPQQPFRLEQQLSQVLKPLAVTYLPLAPEMQRLADQKGLLLHGFPGQEPGKGHWNSQGHRLAAELLARQLCGR
jgi:hypothetical protein